MIKNINKNKFQMSIYKTVSKYKRCKLYIYYESSMLLITCAERDF